VDKADRFRDGDRLIKMSTCAKEKFGRSQRWMWLKLKSPGFPQPVYIDGSPSLIEREVDEYIRVCIATQPQQQKSRMT
jgi:predicted DNA-binding transcriptional regulator AlpA